MARYSRRRYSTRRSRGSFSRYRSYGRRRTVRGRSRRRSRAGARTARVVIQVVGGAGGVAASPSALGMKAVKPVRARY